MNDTTNVPTEINFKAVPDDGIAVKTEDAVQQPAEAPVVQAPTEGTETVAEKITAVAEAIKDEIISEIPKIEEVVKNVEDAVKNTATEVVDELADVDINSKIAYQTILTYMTNMAPRVPVTIEDGVRHQISLYRALTSIINNTEKDFNLVFGTLLKLFDEHKDGVFREASLFRFTEHITLPDNDRKSFLRILNMFKLTASPLSREIAVKQINFPMTLEFIGEKGKSKIMSFFRV